MDKLTPSTRAREIFASELEAEAEACGPWSQQCSPRWQGSTLRGRATEVRINGYLDADDALTLRAITRAEQETEQRVRAEGWQPIETAPKDGTPILIAGGTYEWDDSMCGPQPFRGPTIVRFDNGICAEEPYVWQGGNIGGHDQFNWHAPTHWRPLPEPPLIKEPGK